MNGNSVRTFSFLLKCLLVLLIIVLAVEYMHYILAAALVWFIVCALSNSNKGGQRLHEFPNESTCEGNGAAENSVPHSSKYK